MSGVIKISCFKCHKPKMIKTISYATLEYAEIVVLNSCHKCGYRPHSNKIEYKIDRDKKWASLKNGYKGFEIHKQGPTWGLHILGEEG